MEVVGGDNIQSDCRSESTKPYDLSMRVTRATKAEWSPEVIEVPDDESTSPAQSPEIDILNEPNPASGILNIEHDIKTEADPSTSEYEEASTSTDKRFSAFQAYKSRNYLQPHITPPLYPAQQMHMPSPFPSIYNYDSRAMTYPFSPWDMLPQSSFHRSDNGNFMESDATHVSNTERTESLGLEKTPFSEYFGMNEIDRYTARFGMGHNLRSSWLQGKLDFIPTEDNNQNRNFSFHHGRNFEEKLNSLTQNLHSRNFGDPGKHPTQLERSASYLPDLEALRNSLPYEPFPVHYRNERSHGNRYEILNRLPKKTDSHCHGLAFQGSKFHGQRSYSTDRQRIRHSNQALEITAEERKPLVEYVRQEMIKRLNERRDAKRKGLIDLKRRKVWSNHSSSPSPDDDLNSAGTSRVLPHHPTSSNDPHSHTASSHPQSFMTFTQKNLYLDHPYYKCTKETKSSLPQDRSNIDETKSISKRSNSPCLNVSTHKRQKKRCSFCLNHNLTILVRGHKGKCAYKECKCRACEITRSRQLHVMREHRIVKERAKNELLILEEP